jgi:ribose transport system ATP-binding protein
MATSTERPVVLRMTNISKTFGATRALRDVDFELQAGEIHALVGENGSGKSTLTKVLAGFHEPDPGAIAFVRDAPLALGDADAAHAAGLRFVHQDLGLIDALDSTDNLALGFGFATGFGGRIVWRRQRAAARASLARLGQDFNVRVPVSWLTAFEKTALAITRALQDIDATSVLILDEPTATMPKPEVDRLFALIRRVAAQGTGVLLITHHLDEVYDIADRVTVLRDGLRVITQEVTRLPRADLIHNITGGHIVAVDHSPRTIEGPVALSARGLVGAVLRGIDFEVRSGEVLGIAGLNGSGRDEVCSLIFGARRRSGAVELNGKLLPQERPDLAIAAGCALVPANRHIDGLVMEHTVRENLTLVDVARFWRRLRLQQRQETKSVRDWIARLGIRTESPEQLVETLSGGNQQKVVLGKWLSVQPVVLLLDEPTQGVDVGAQSEIHQQIRAAAETGTAVLVCSSDEGELSQLCDRVLVLYEGTVVDEMSGSQLSAREIARRCLRPDPVVPPRPDEPAATAV